MKLKTSGQRILYARNISGLTRAEFCEKYDVPIITLRSWELSDDIKEKAANRFCKALRSEGFYCDPIWIVKGIGYLPHLVCSKVKCIPKQLGDKFDEKVVNEIEFFKKNHKNIVPLLVVDNTMNPFLHIGDYIAGIYTNDLKILTNQPCIVETISGQNLIKIFCEPAEKNKYILSSINSKEKLVLYKTEVKNLAKIIWIRKRLK